MKQGSFTSRHIGPRASQVSSMLEAININSVNDLMEKTIPANIRRKALTIGEGMSESEFLAHIEELGGKNTLNHNFIGLGYYPTITPPVILRNVLENPGWYTAYTPYQAEIAQGRLEALLNFQTMVSDLTGMEIANASLLDEGTAAAEAMIMFYNTRSRGAAKAGVNKCFVDVDTYPQTLDVLETRAKYLGIELVVGDFKQTKVDESYFAALVQYPSGKGEVRDYQFFAEACQNLDIKVGVATDLMALALLKAPGDWGADAVYGNSQRFGVPMGYGGPHAAFFATKESYKRNIPGRIIGVSQDRLGQVGYRMALQTREQHIRRDKATSNICTAQALLAVMASMYAVYHGQEGVKAIANKIHQDTASLAKGLRSAGYSLQCDQFFDTLNITGLDQAEWRTKCDEQGVNLGFLPDGSISISLFEGVNQEHITALETLFGIEWKPVGSIDFKECERTSDFMTHEVFQTYRSETEMMRYMKRLENKDLSLVHSMIPLGSCTMKLNAAAELMPITMPEWANLHPFAALDQAKGYQEMLTTLKKDLAEVTGFADVSLQPNS
ncbi:MAG: glycine dehydrogenase (aminomethyl-transferring), partial [Bacteroidota bacterium]